MEKITVKLREDLNEKFIVDAVVSDGCDALTYEVDVVKSDYKRLTDADVSVEELVRASFEFLLARESKESILRTFDLMTIKQYFPEYEDEVKMIIIKSTENNSL